MSTASEAESRRGTRIDKLVIDLENGRVEVSGWSMDHSASPGAKAAPLKLGEEAVPPDDGDAPVPSESPREPEALVASDPAPDVVNSQEESTGGVGDEPIAATEDTQANDETGQVLAEAESATVTFAERADEAIVGTAADGAPAAESSDEPEPAATAAVATARDGSVVAAHEPTPPPAPVQAVAIANRKTARCGDTVMLSGEASHSAAGPIAEYQWDFDGDGTFDDAFGAAVEHTLVALPRTDGVYRPVALGLRVVDVAGNASTTQVEIVPGPRAENRPPSVQITPRFTYVDREGQEDVVIDASATDDPDGPCDHLRYQWTCESAGNGVCRTEAMELTGPVLRIPWQSMETDTTYFWKLTVTDIAGAQAVGSAVIESVSRMAPREPTIEVRGKPQDDGLRANCIYKADTHEPIWCAD